MISDHLSNKMTGPNCWCIFLVAITSILAIAVITKLGLHIAFAGTISALGIECVTAII